MKRLFLRLKAKLTGKPQRLSFCDYGNFDVETIVLPDGSLRHITFEKALRLPTVRPQKIADAEPRGSETVILDAPRGVPCEWSPSYDELGHPIRETSWTVDTDARHRRVGKDFDGVRITKNIELK